MGDWTNYRIPVETDEGNGYVEWDVRHDGGEGPLDGVIDISENGVNKYTLSVEDALVLVKAITEVLVKECD